MLLEIGTTSQQRVISVKLLHDTDYKYMIVDIGIYVADTNHDHGHSLLPNVILSYYSSTHEIVPCTEYRHAYA